MSRSAIGCVGTPTQRGQIIAGRRSTSATTVSNAALPGPTTIAARSVVTGTAPVSSRRPVSIPAAEVRRELGFAVAEPAEVDQLADTGTLRLGRERAGSAKVAILEVGTSERMNQVVGDLDAIERSAHRLGIDRISLAPFDAVGVGARAARDPDHLVALGEHRQERCADRPGRAEDCDSHSTPSLARRAK